MRQVLKRVRALAAAVAVVALTSTAMAAPARAEMTNRSGGGVTSAIVAKQGSTGSLVTTIQTNLVVLGYLDAARVNGTWGLTTTAAVKAFQAGQKLDQTGVMTKREAYILQLRADAKRKTAFKLDQRCATGRVICINRTTKKMYWVINGQIQKTYDVRTGRKGMETRLGSFKIYYKTTNSWSYLYDVWMPYSQYFDGGIAVHYSAEFATYGYGLGSHGCVNMNSKTDAAWLYSQTKTGDKVVVYA